MHGEPASVRILREALESVLSQAAAAAVVFEGLSAWGERVPSDATELREALEGPIREALTRRLPAHEAAELVRALVLALATAEATTDVKNAVDVDLSELDERTDERPTTPRPRFPNERSTRGLPTRTGPVPVLVLAGTRSFAARLRLAVGAGRVAPTQVRDLEGLRGALAAAAALVIVDATDIPPVDPDTVVRALAEVGSGCVPVVYGSDLPFGRRVAQALASRRVRAVTIAQRDGIEPIIDLVRSFSPS